LREKSAIALGAQIDALIALDYHRTSAFDRILARLGDEEIRSELERLLEQITDEDFGVGWDATEEEITRSMNEWRAWYAQNAGRRR